MFTVAGCSGPSPIQTPTQLAPGAQHHGQYCRPVQRRAPPSHGELGAVARGAEQASWVARPSRLTSRWRCSSSSRRPCSTFVSTWKSTRCDGRCPSSPVSRLQSPLLCSRTMRALPPSPSSPAAGAPAAQESAVRPANLARDDDAASPFRGYVDWFVTVALDLDATTAVAVTTRAVSR